MTPRPYHGVMKTTSRVLACVAIGGGLLIATPDAHAQDSKKKGPVELKTPVPTKEDADRPIITTYLLLVVILAAVIGVNCIPSKRGHQD